MRKERRYDGWVTTRGTLIDTGKLRSAGGNDEIHEDGDEEGENQETGAAATAKLTRAL